jgi:hypothetical protein
MLFRKAHQLFTLGNCILQVQSKKTMLGLFTSNKKNGPFQKECYINVCVCLFKLKLQTRDKEFKNTRLEPIQPSHQFTQLHSIQTDVQSQNHYCTLVVTHLSLANWLTMVVVTQNMREFLLGTYRNLKLVLFITFLVSLLAKSKFFQLMDHPVRWPNR